MLSKSLPVPGWGCPLRLHRLTSDVGGCHPAGMRDGGGVKTHSFLSRYAVGDPLSRHCSVTLVVAQGPHSLPPACFLLCRWVCPVLAGGAAAFPCVLLTPRQIHLHVFCALTESGEAWLLQAGPSVFLSAYCWREVPLGF